MPDLSGATIVSDSQDDVVTMHIPDSALVPSPGTAQAEGVATPFSEPLPTSSPQSTQVQEPQLSTVINMTPPLKISTTPILPIAVPQSLHSQEIKEEDISLYKTSSEKSLEKYIFDNIKTLWKDIFDEKVIDATRQYASIGNNIEISPGRFIAGRGMRVDLSVTCESGNRYLIEIKNPSKGSFDAVNAIGKMLYYSIIFPEANKYVIITTFYDKRIQEVLAKYNLPIDFVLFGKDNVYLLKK